MPQQRGTRLSHFLRAVMRDSRLETMKNKIYLLAISWGLVFCLGLTLGSKFFAKHDLISSAETQRPTATPRKTKDRTPKPSICGLIETIAKDPAEAYRMAQKESVSGASNDLLSQAIFQEWAKTAPQEAFQSALLIEDAELSRLAIETTLLEILRNDPPTALKMLKGLPNAKLSASLAAKFFQLWAKQDVEGVKTVLGDLKSVTRLAAIAAIGLQGGDAPESSIRYMENLRGQDKSVFLLSLIRGWAAKDPEGAHKYLGSGNIDATTSASVASVIGSQWAKLEPEKALTWASQLKPGALQQNALLGIVESIQLNGTSNDDLFRLVTAWAPGKFKDEVVGHLIGDWRGGEFRDIANVVYQGDVSVLGTGAEASFAERWVSTNFEEAKDYLITQSMIGKAPFLTSAVLRELANTSPGEAVDLGEKVVRESNGHIASKILRGLMQDSPEVAKQLIIRVADSTLASDLVNSFSAQYAKQNPQEAVNWIATSAPEASRGDALAIAFSQWIDLDEGGASVYLADLPPSKQRDAGAAALSLSLANTSLEDALKWAVSVRNERLRQDSLAQIGKHINFNKFDESTEAIMNSGIDSSEIYLLEKNAKR